MFYSVVMEWDNPVLSSTERAVQSLKRLVEQMRALPNEGELLLMWASKRLPQNDVAAWAVEFCQGITVRSIDTGDLTYYQLKNRGVQQALGQWVVFVDSDVLIEPGWLEQMLKPLESGEGDVTCGATYLDHGNLYERTMALTWFFPLRAPDGPTRPVPRFFANSVAAGRETFLRFPFERTGRTYRGQCVRAAKEMRKAGLRLIHQPMARAAHPPPNGWFHFFHRAWMTGSDRFVMVQDHRGTFHAIFRGIFHHWRKCPGDLFRIFCKGNKVGLPLWQWPGAACIYLTFQFAASIGSIGAAVLGPQGGAEH